MKPKEKSTELIDKFGVESIDIIKNTIDLWIEKLKYPKIYSKEICLRTLKYWRKTEKETKQRLLLKQNK